LRYDLPSEPGGASMPDSLYDTDILIWSEHQADPHWRGEVNTFLADAQDRFSPSMRQRIDLAALYAQALSRLRDEARGKRDPRLPANCPFVLDDLLVAEPDIEALLAKVGAANG
jgi:hypothetical protein